MDINNRLELLNKIRNKAIFVKTGCLSRVDPTLNYFVVNMNRTRYVGYRVNEPASPVWNDKDEISAQINGEDYKLQSLD